MREWLLRAHSAWRPGLSTAIILLGLTVLSTAEFDKRDEMSPVPFVMGSRYGRSSEMKLVSPRIDRFFMGSRYGKRSDSTEPRAAKLFEGVMNEPGGGDDTKRLLCEFTGVLQLYRCVTNIKRDHYDVRIADESGMPEEV